MKCKICLTFDPIESGSICHSCSIAIQAMDLFIEDLGNYLSSADSERLPDHYAKNIPYFVSTLSFYNRYVSIKNLIQEVAITYLTNEQNEKIFRQDIENSEPLKNENTVKVLEENQLISSKLDITHDDFLIIPMDRVTISLHVFDNFDLEGEGFYNYFNSLFLFSMLVMVKSDLTSWTTGNIKNFPRKGFLPIRLISGAVERAIESKTEEHYITTEEIYRSMKGINNKSQTKIFSQMIGMDFQSRSIFETIPDPDKDAQANLTKEISEMVDHLAERIRERTDDREHER